MLVIAIADKGRIPIGKVSCDTKAMLESGALPGRINDTNNDVNSANIDKITTAKDPKKGFIYGQCW